MSGTSGSAAARARDALGERTRGLRTTLVPLAQTAGAAGAAWALAHDVIGHRTPFFAPVAATIVLGLGPGRRGPRAVEMVLGVAVGIGIGDLLIAAIGSGAGQIALVVLLAMAAAVLLGGGPLVASQAASSAVLVAALPAQHGIPTRFVDALVGGSVGLVVLVAVPRNPLTAVERTTAPLFDELAHVLDAIAAALERRDVAAAEHAHERARAAGVLTTRFRDALGPAQETVRLAPSYWRARGEIERYAAAFPYVDYAQRNVRVLARAALTALEQAASYSAGLPHAVHTLADGVRALAPELGAPSGSSAAMETLFDATGEASVELDSAPPLPVTVMVAQVRSTVVDLLRALGVDRADAVRHVRASARERRAQARTATGPGASLPPAPGSASHRG